MEHLGSSHGGQCPPWWPPPDSVGREQCKCMAWQSRVDRAWSNRQRPESGQSVATRGTVAGQERSTRESTTRVRQWTLDRQAWNAGDSRTGSLGANYTCTRDPERNGPPEGAGANGGARGRGRASASASASTSTSAGRRSVRLE